MITPCCDTQVRAFGLKRPPLYLRHPEALAEREPRRATARAAAAGADSSFEARLSSRLRMTVLHSTARGLRCASAPQHDGVESLALPIMEGSLIGQHRPDIGFRGDRAVDLGLAVKPPHGLAAADGAHVILDGLTGHHRLPELALVDGQEIDRTRLLGPLDRFDTDHARGLRHRLDHHHAGIDRALGEMT